LSNSVLESGHTKTKNNLVFGVDIDCGIERVDAWLEDNVQTGKELLIDGRGGIGGVGNIHIGEWDHSFTRVE